MSIRYRLLLLFLFLGVLPLLVFVFFNLRADEASLRAETLARLNSLADKKVHQVQDYLHERLQDVDFQARSPRVLTAMSAMPALYAQNRNGSGYMAQDGLTRAYFAPYVEESGLFYDAFLISAQGEIVYTQKHESDFATNLVDGPLRDTPLAQAFDKVRKTMQPVISDYAMYQPSQEPALFVAAPVQAAGKFAGVFAFQVSNKLLYRVALDQTGLGASGEAEFAKREGDGVLFTTPLRYQPDAALKFRLKAAAHKAASIFQATSGNAGAGFVEDYRGVPVAAAWRYIPELEWGMVVKVDEAEALASIRSQRWSMLGMLAVLLLLAAAGAWLFGRQVLRPLAQLTEDAGELAQGKLDRRADEGAPGELGQFAQSFNRMADSLRDIYRTLEERITARTEELHAANEQLQEEVNERMHAELTLQISNDELLLYKRFIDSSSNAMAIALMDGQLTYGNEAFVRLLGIAPEEIGRIRFQDFIEPEFRGPWQDEFSPAAQREGAWTGDMALRNRGEQRRDVHLELFVVNDSSGNPYAMAAVIEDVTDRRAIERELQQSQLRALAALDELRYQKFALDQHAIVATTDVNGSITYANDKFCEISGYSVEELLGQNHRLLNSGVHPTEFFREMYRTISAGKVWNGEVCNKAKDGRLYWVLTTIVPYMDDKGDPTQYIAIRADITERKAAEKQLEHQHELFDETQRLGQLGSWELDLVGGSLYWSDEIFRIFELDPEKFSPSYENFLNAIHPDDRDAVNKAYSQSLEDRRPYDIVHRLKMPDGRIKWVHEHCNSEFDADGKPLRSVGAVQDITVQQLAENQLRIAAAAFETHEAIMITDVDACILRVNRAFEETTGYSAEEVLGQNPRILSSGRQDQAFYEEMWKALTIQGTWSGEMWDRRKSGEVYPKWVTITAVRNDAGQISEYVAIFSDITERKKAEQEIRNLAFYDALTKLPNRRLLMDRLHQALIKSVRDEECGAVLFMDMDRFKVLNDTLGHDYGDLMLIEVAERIEACVREVDTVARLGGDEFVVLLEELGEDSAEASRRAASVAEKIRESLARPYLLKDTLHHSSPSIGVSLFRGDELTVDTLIKQADMAMYKAKESGRNAVRFFDPDMQESVESRARIEADLRNAIPNGELRLYYQIQVDQAYQPVGAEALVRWVHPVRGMVMPGQFIPVAEESSLIIDLGNWVLEEGCRQLGLWSRYKVTRNLTLAINVSAAQFRLPDFVDRVSSALERNGVAPARLKLELTESAMMTDVAAAIEKMQALRKLGVKLSLDDFGTGYSSLSNLKRLPIDQLKIDQSFVRDIAVDSSDAVMVRTIIDMAQNFELEVVAEGVETEEQRQFLKRHGCQYYQGYLFSKPVPVEDFEKLLGGLQ